MSTASPVAEHVEHHEQVVFSVANYDTDKLKVTVIAANEMQFLVKIESQRYDETFADICELAPVLMSYDADLTEAYDDAFRTKTKPRDRFIVNRFVAKYRGRLWNISVMLPGWEVVPDA